MKKTIIISIVAVTFGVFSCTAAFGDFNASVETDKLIYHVGETVSWELYAWADVAGSGAGVSLVAMDLADSTDDQMNQPDTELLFGILLSLLNSDYGALDGFILMSLGVIPPNGDLLDITVRQGDSTRVLNQGNDGAPHLYCQGSYQVFEIGIHDLTPGFVAANYWTSDTGPAAAFAQGTMTGARFTVIPEPATMMLLGTGLLGVLGVVRRRRMK